jgi:hypothetical protein
MIHAGQTDTVAADGQFRLVIGGKSVTVVPRTTPASGRATAWTFYCGSTPSASPDSITKPSALWRRRPNPRKDQ